MENSDEVALPSLKILHVIAKSYPALNGYTVRSHEIFKAQKKTGEIIPLAITSPYYPEIKEMSEGAIIDGIEYHRTVPRRSLSTMDNWKNLPWFLRVIIYPLRLLKQLLIEKSLMGELEKEIENITKEEGPDILQAHTPFKVGLPTMRVARKLGKPFIYEVRGLWEESAIARGRFSKWNPRYWRFRLMETRTMRSADKVFCLSKTMKDQLISRGVNGGNIAIIRNGAPGEYLEEWGEKELRGRENEDSSLLRVKKISESNSIIGYVGSIQEYEGLGDLIEAVGEMISQQRKVHLLIVSNGENKTYLDEICREKKIQRNVTLVGPIPRDEIREYYEQIDIIAIPRLSGSMMARIVTPLKPMEALALGIPLIISDTPAIRELVGHGTATLFKSGNIPELFEKLCMIMDDEIETKKKVERGIVWIRDKGTWEISAKKTLSEYNQLLESRNY